LLPGIRGKFSGQRLDRDRPMRLVAAQPLGRPAATGTRRRRKRRLARPPNRRGGLDTDRVRHPEFSDPSSKTAVVAIRWISQHHGWRHAVRKSWRNCCSAIAGLVWNEMSSGMPATVRRTGSSAQSFGRYNQ
jgi:hypothetical protein